MFHYKFIVMEKNYSYVSPELDLVEVDSYVCCMGDSPKPGGGTDIDDGDDRPGSGGGDDW